MPPNIRLPPLSISITLTPLRGSESVRIITLKPSEPCLIGRASKSTLKKLESRHDNALFDCPVVSREHAELKAHLWDLVENQITITDKGSMHGTRVNGEKLSEGKPKTLRPGDIIQFGEKVSRGDNTHDGVFVTFNHHENFTQESHTLPAYSTATNKSGIYSYPYTSDDESDYDSDDHISLLSDNEDMAVASSAKTTPEQAKVKLGSQEQPIDLDGPVRAKRILVEDSVDPQASIFVADSVPAMKSKIQHVDVVSDDGRIVDEQDIKPFSNTLAAARATSTDSVQHESDDEDEIDYPDDEEAEGVEGLSEGNASDLGRYSQLENSEDERHEAAEMMAGRSPSPSGQPEEKSPELRSSGHRRLAADLVVPSSSFTQPSASTLPPLAQPFSSSHGSVHRSQPLGMIRPIAHQNPYDTGTYHLDTFTGSSSFGRPQIPSYEAIGRAYPAPSYPPYPNGSRWDKPPTYSRIEPLPPFQSSYLPDREVYASSTDNFDFFNSRNGAPSMGISGDAFEADTRDGHYTPQSPKLPPALAQSMHRISIPNIVEGRNDMGAASANAFKNIAPEQTEPSFKDASAMIDEAKAMVDKASQEIPLAAASSSSTITPAAGTKRKMDDLQDHPDSLTNQVVAGALDDLVENLPALGNEPAAEGTAAPAPKRLKTFALNVAKYGAVASAGGAAMLGFLCSPAAESLLTWMS